MTLAEIKQIDIREYLQKIDINPIRSNNRYGMYHSPFREDKDASMKVDFNQNLWIDYGTGEGGSIIDLVSKMGRCSISEAINKLKYNSFSFHRNSIPNEEKSAITIRKVQSLSNPALLDYLKERKISIDIAKSYCKEVYYSVYNKSYFAIGFKNNSGGYVIRNKYFKGCTSNDITLIKRDTDNCLLFEGFMDFLSYLTLIKNQIPEHDTIILNSVNNFSKAKNALTKYPEIIAFLDNDESGKKILQEVRKISMYVRDMSVHYAKQKDLNDYLCSPLARIKKKLEKDLCK